MKSEYIDHMGTDLRVVNSARVSFNKQSYKITRDDERLIHYLARNGHWTPFAHPQITMRETVPIFVARQRFKHTVGFVYNEVSRRYVDDVPEFFEPDEWRTRPEGSVKQGSGGTMEPTEKSTADLFLREAHNDAYHNYANLLAIGVSPEQARMVLPQSMYTSYYVTGSLAAWARAYNQRSAPDAQVEIQDLARQWDVIIERRFPVSWEALTGETNEAIK